MAVNAVIWGDVRLFRDGLAALLRESAQIDVGATADSAEDVCAMVARQLPDVLLVDMAMTDALQQVRAVSAAHPSLKIVALAVPETATDVIACAEAGAMAYVPREASVEDLVAALEAAACGELRCSPRMAAALLQHVAELKRSSGGAPTPGLPLTVRELDVLRLLEAGRSNKEIARALGIELATAKNHVHNILEKLGVRRRVQVIPLAARWLLPSGGAAGQARRSASSAQPGRPS